MRLILDGFEKVNRGAAWVLSAPVALFVYLLSLLWRSDQKE